MSNQDSNQKELMIERISQINKVEGFDPTPFALELTDLNTMKVRTIIPVSVQIAWFKLKYPDGKIVCAKTKKGGGMLFGRRFSHQR